MKQPALGSVLGIARRTWSIEHGSGTLEEEIFACVHSALNDAGMSIADVTAIVTGSSDQLDGRSISLMLTSGSVGGPGREILNVCSSGEHALILGAMRIAAGHERIVLVVSWGCPAEADVSAVERLSIEPYFTRNFGVSRLAAQAMGASRYVDTYQPEDTVVDAFLDAVAPEIPRRASMTDWLCWPLREQDLPPVVNRATALVVGSPAEVGDARRRPVRIVSVGWEQSGYWPQDRQFDTAAAGVAAVRRALDAGGVSLEDCAATEWHCLDPYHAFATAEGLGLAPPGEGAKWYQEHASSGTCGTSYAGDSLFATGLDRVAALAERLRAVAQIDDGDAEAQTRGLAHAVNGIAGQGGAAFVLEVEL